jgi:hypothetical protein
MQRDSIASIHRLVHADREKSWPNVVLVVAVLVVIAVAVQW